MKKFLSLVLALVMTMSLVTVSAGAKDFTDSSKITYKEAVDVMFAVKVIDGYTDGSFNPSATLTRGAAAKIICNLILGPTTASALVADAAPYKDVPTNHTFAGYIAYCQKTGIISGYADGTFKPANSLTGYAFMKMLLGALGYKAENEGYTGANWSINVAKRALNVGLSDDLVCDFNGVKAVNREEACLYAFNTLKATMVEYEKNSTVTVGNITIKDTSDAKEMTNTAKTDGNIDKDGKMQFAEKYFTDLRLNDNATDPFMRPANQWKIKSEEIGTYAQTPDLTYTAAVKSSAIYKDLALGDAIEKKNVSVYVDGESADAYAIRKNDNDTEFGGNGVLTEVFYDKNDDSVVITEVMTYFGQINKTVKATSTADAYVEVLTGDAAADNVKKNTAANSTEKYETNETFEDDAYVLYTFSVKEDEIQSVELAKSVAGTVTKVENDKKVDASKNKNVTINGETYKASATMANEILDKVSPKNDYTLYLDSYGYGIFVEEEEYVSTDFALLKDYRDKNSFDTNRALLVLADGTEKIVDTAKNYKKAGSDHLDIGTIVTYKVNDANEYTLKEVKTTEATAPLSSKTTALKDYQASTKFKMETDKATITTGTSDKNAKGTIYANSKTTFVVYNNADDEWTSYTGIKNAPSVTAAAKKGAVAFWYCKGTSTIATIVYIVPMNDDIVEDTNNKNIFIAGESVSNYVHDGDDYYTYNAVVGGEIKTVKVDASAKVYENDGKTLATDKDGNSIKAYALNGVYGKYSTDSDGFITKLVQYKDTADKTYAIGVGLDKNSEDYTVIVNTVNNGANKKTITVDDDAKFYNVDKDGNITAGSYKTSVVKDEDDIAYYIVEDGMVTTMYVEEVETKDAANGTVTLENSVNNNNADITVDNGADAVVLTVVAKGATKNDVVESYQWYKDGKKLAAETGKTLTIATDKASDSEYYCKVVFANDKVNGNGVKVVTSDSIKVTVNAYVQTANVAVYFTTDGTKATTVGTDVVTVKVQGGVLATVTAKDVTLPDGYKLATDSGLPAGVTIGGTPEVIVTVEKA